MKTIQVIKNRVKNEGQTSVMECVMNIDVNEFVKECGLDEPLYPGKRLVKKMPQPGEFKSHCVVYDWRAPETLRVEVKAGQSGRTLDNKELSKFPVTFQAPTYLDIRTDNALNDNKDKEDEDDETKGKSGGGGGGKKPAKKNRLNEALNAFSEVVEGDKDIMGKIEKLVVMGKEVAQEAMAHVLETLVAQIKDMKISPTDLLAQAGKFVTKFTPPPFLQPKGNEDAVYKYDREKNEPMFGGGGPSLG